MSAINPLPKRPSIPPVSSHKDLLKKVSLEPALEALSYLSTEDRKKFMNVSRENRAKIHTLAEREKAIFLKILGEIFKNLTMETHQSAYQYLHDVIEDELTFDRDDLSFADKKNRFLGELDYKLGFNPLMKMELLQREGDIELKKNKELVRLLVEINGENLKYADPVLQNDPDIVKVAIRQNGNAFRYASPDIRGNLEIVKIAVAKDGMNLEHVSKILQDDEIVVQIAVAQNGSALRHASERLQDDEKIVQTAVAGNGYALEHASERLKGDLKTVKIAINTTPYAAQFVSETMGRDPEFGKMALAMGTPFHILSDELKDNAEFVKAAWASGLRELRLVSVRLKDDASIVQMAVSKDGMNLQYASPRLRDDPTIVLAAVTQSKDALIYAEPRWRNDLECAKMVVTQTGSLRYLSNELKDHPEIEAILDEKRRSRDLDVKDS